jgi:hypothetical protein
MGLTREEAIRRLEAMYQEARSIPDDKEAKTALAISKELHRLLGLYTAPEPAEESTGEQAALAAIRAHLEPLGLGPAGTPVEELARLEALKILNQ